MILYLSATTNIPDAYIDYIAVRLNTGEEVSLNWDESEIYRDEKGFETRYKGVYFGDDYANGRIDELKDLELQDVGLYFESEGKFHFRIDEMQFEDGEETLTIKDPAPPEEVYEDWTYGGPTSLEDKLCSAVARTGGSAPDIDSKEKDLGL